MAEAARVKVFITWSGDQSRIVAEALKVLLKRVIQSCEPFLSTHIEGGSKWLDEISRQLALSPMGVICVTAENQREPWLNFEAGAISTFARPLLRPDEAIEARVCPYLLDVKPTDVDWPLAMFQAKVADRQGTKAVIQMVNRHAPIPFTEDAELEDAFSRHWDDFEKQLVEARKVAPARPRPKRTDSNKLDELPTGMRRVEHQLAAAESRASPLPTSYSHAPAGSLPGIGLGLSSIGASPPSPLGLSPAGAGVISDYLTAKAGSFVVTPVQPLTEERLKGIEKLRAVGKKREGAGKKD
jgi:hypothetical protein